MANTSLGSGSSSSIRVPRNRPRFSLISLFTNQGQGDGTSQKKLKSKKKRKRGDAISSTSQYQTAIEEQASSYTVSIRINEKGIQIRECPLCYDELELHNFPEVSSCGHRSCSSCLDNYLEIEVGESRVDVTCPECPARLHPTDIHKLLKRQKTVDKYEEFMVRKVLVTHPDTRWCPAPDCGFAVIAHGCAPCPKLQCERPGCNTLFCYHCKQEWHENQTCDAARCERLPFTHLSYSESLSHNEEYKQCPRCRTMINKMNDGSCNHMTCSICSTRFCWLCLKEASDLHYLSPSGCTFWGKKPWSRKKKILWQLGTLIGAPIGIALLAGLSVPILVFGLPIWAGRKLYQKFKKDKKHKRNAIVVFGSIAAFIASPVVAGLAIAVGVPITLTYVYGVVPISLCRGGTCGVKSTSGTFSFDFSSSTPPQGTGECGDIVQSTLADSSSLAAVSRFSASLSQIDHEVDQLLDRGSDIGNPSMRNLAGGTSISGSLYNEDNSEHKRVEILAEVNNGGAQRKPSIDLSQGDNASIAADERSVKSTNTDNRSHVSFQLDNASTRALAGSRCGKDIETTTNGTLIVDSSDTRSVRSRIKGDYGSPVSNRSVSFANVDESKHTTRSSKYNRCSRKDRLSLKSMDSASNGSTSDATIVTADTELTANSGKGTSYVDSSDQTLTKVEVNTEPVNLSGDKSRKPLVKPHIMNI